MKTNIVYYDFRRRRMARVPDNTPVSLLPFIVAFSVGALIADMIAEFYGLK